MISVELIEAVLIERDPESLISIGAPSDEYKSEAIKIHDRLINKRLNLIEITSAITFVFYESFGSAIKYSINGNEEFSVDYDYLNEKRFNEFTKIGNLIFNIYRKSL